MKEKRKHARYGYLDYFEGNPKDIDISLVSPIQGHGIILDISQGGMLMASDLNVSVGMPIRVGFTIKGESVERLGKIVRTGELRNNPSEIIKNYLNFKGHEKNYIAIQFDDILAELAELTE